MNHSARIMINHPTAAYGGNSKNTTRLEEERVEYRPTFASRVAKLIFRQRRSAGELRAKSWPGREGPVPITVPVARVTPTSAERQLSASIAIPNSLGSSASASVPRTRSMRIPKRSGAHASSSEAEWRHRQAHCANCERLFFKSMSTLGRFCSLDCKANFEYLDLLQETMDAGLDCTSSGSFDSSLEGDDDS